MMNLKKKTLRLAGFFCIWTVPLFSIGTFIQYVSAGGDNETIKVFVSIQPQAYFVERIGGNRVDVKVMVRPGFSPATYEPIPQQMAALGKARLYFRIGVPFEDVWISRLGRVNPDMQIIDTRKGITLLPMKGLHGHGGLKDPHIWLSLRLVKVQAQNICDALVDRDPGHAVFYRKNLETFHRDLDTLDKEIAGTLDKLRNRKFIVFHPSLGYFARDYHLEQIPIEVEGKDPGARTLAHLIDTARQEDIRVVFVQAQFSKTYAKTVARAIDGKVVQIDPLAAEDYMENMRKIAQTFAEVMQWEN